MQWRDPELQRLAAELTLVETRSDWKRWAAAAGPLIRAKHKEESANFQELATMPESRSGQLTSGERGGAVVLEQVDAMRAFLQGLDAAPRHRVPPDLEAMTLGDWIGAMRPKQLVGIVTVVLALLSAAFYVGRITTPAAATTPVEVVKKHNDSKEKVAENTKESSRKNARGENREMWSEPEVVELRSRREVTLMLPVENELKLSDIPPKRYGYVRSLLPGVVASVEMSAHRDPGFPALEFHKLGSGEIRLLMYT